MQKPPPLDGKLSLNEHSHRFFNARLANTRQKTEPTEVNTHDWHIRIADNGDGTQNCPVAAERNNVVKRVRFEIKVRLHNRHIAFELYFVFYLFKIRLIYICVDPLSMKGVKQGLNVRKVFLMKDFAVNDDLHGAKVVIVQRIAKSVVLLRKN